jgi:hypothetical protein
MINTLNQFMKGNFCNLTLRPPLFYLWKYGIRFEISMPFVKHKEKSNLQQIHERSTGIFKKIFDNTDGMLLVTDVHCKKNDTFLQQRPLKVYQKYIKNQKILRRLQHKVLPNVFIEDEDGEGYADMVTHRFVLSCKVNEIRYAQLLSAISYEDFPHPTRILNGFSRNGYDIYFINLTKKMIYHFYDDRGCDVIASNKEDLRYLYEDCNDWILDYNRKEIDLLFM